MAKPKTPANETKTQKFVRIAQLRTNKALDAIAALGGLSVKANYDYTDEQWQKIVGAMNAEIQKVVDKVKAGGATASEGGFSL